MRPIRVVLLFVSLSVLFVLGFAARQAHAEHSSPQPAPPSTLHPTFALLDVDGNNVLDSNQPVSTIRTCGQCHDTQFISSHSFHADLGLSDFTAPGSVAGGHPWDQSNGPFGKWNPLINRLLSPLGDERVDQDTAGWIKTNAARLIGGGPAVTGRGGKALLQGDPAAPSWDWQQSGVYEMDCFLCHTPAPNNSARIAALQSGQFGWANTATLVGSGLVDLTSDQYIWNRQAFAADGKLKQVTIQDPTNENCAQCHGMVHTNPEPLTLSGCDLTNWQTSTTGQVISADKISDSGMNLANKDALTRSWDVHAERGLKCTDCHYALNNPAYYQAESSPAHLQFDPRRLDIGQYLQNPNHNFARGQSAQNTVAPELKGTMRRCESCHSAADSHQWLPYQERHMAELACESCHIPDLHAPAIQAYDWTSLKADGTPLVTCRGVEGNSSALSGVVTGFQPVLLPRIAIDGKISLAPYNLITSWYWVYDSPQGPRPVRQEDLHSAYFAGSQYTPEVVAAFDANHDGSLSEAELTVDTPEKQTTIARRLLDLGLQNPRIEGEVQPYSINHDVTHGDWAVRECKSCHSAGSRISQPMQLSTYVPGGVLPEFVKDANTANNGRIYTASNGSLYYQPATRSQKLYIFGLDRVPWVDGLGVLMFLGVLGAVTVHGGIRFYASRRLPDQTNGSKKVYMYSFYERFWHWLQTFAILLLLFTGMIIHRPDIFWLFNLRYIVAVHNILALLLVINALLSLFYHLVSGEIRQYIPHPYGFFDQAIVQTKYYLSGIFRHAEHPFEKVPEKKLNPLQQVTYFGILTFALPLMMLTGMLMWGVQQFPLVASLLGGLPLLAPLHTLGAWLLAAFLVGHVYLTTTGSRPLTSLNAMLNGWDEVAEHELELKQELNP